MAKTIEQELEPAAPLLSTPQPHTPYVSPSTVMPEFTWQAVIVGAILGIVFGASSLYLVLKVGLTVSASIPIAVLSITLFRLLAKLPFIRRATILENNIVQTTGSAGESIAFGVGITMPVLFLLGFEMDWVRVMTVGVLGGLLGVLMMIPLRRAFIVNQHGRLKYPEGTACADVLVVGEQGGSSAAAVFTGFGITFIYKLLMTTGKLWKDTLDYRLYSATGQGLKKGVLASELDPALLGVGYIIGPRIASIMVAGGVLAYLVMVPAIAYFGEGLSKPLAPENGKLIKDMSVGQLRSAYIIYIGAGAVATGGILSMIQALPVIVASLFGAFRDLFGRGKTAEVGRTPRTERDLPSLVVWLGSIGLVALIALAPSLGLGVTETTSDGRTVVNWFGITAAALIVLLGFLFVTVSSRLTGEVGSSSNPISGMTVAALLITCLVFVGLGRTSKEASLTALTVAAVVCIASSNGGTTSQDLKTGFLIGATPSKQQWAILIGALTSAAFIGLILLALNEINTVYSKKSELVPNYTIPAETLAILPHQQAGGQYSDDRKLYSIFHVTEGESADFLSRSKLAIPAGKYLADENGKLVYFVDPAINGKLKFTDGGRKVDKYEAPKTQLMAKIISGIFESKLPWNLVLIGVLIAVALELSGVPSLPFAVGVYLPLESSMPIFIGGAIRFVVERVAKSRGLGPASDTESEMSTGSLLSTGYIAGGSIAGVLCAFIAANDSVADYFAKWQYGRTTLTQEYKLPDAFDAVARKELRLPEGNLSDNQNAELQEKVEAFQDINKSEIVKYVLLPSEAKLKVAQGMTVKAGDGNRKLEADEEIAPPADARTLGDFARTVLGDEDKAVALFSLNEKELKLPESLPSGAVLKVPQTNMTPLLIFGVLILILLLGGLGLFLRTGPTAPQPTA